MPVNEFYSRLVLQVLHNATNHADNILGSFTTNL